MRIILVLLLGWFLVQHYQSPQSKIPAPHISIVENATLVNTTPEIKAVAVLPVKFNLRTNDKVILVKTSEIGVSVASNLTLEVNYSILNKALDARGVDSMKSSPNILAALSRGAANVEVVAKKPKPPQPVPDYVPAPQPITPVPAPAPVAPVARSYTYCVAVRGVDPANLPELEAKLASVYSDARGWSLGGINTFTEASSGCSLVVWLTAADQMPSFGAICDSMWSCTVYPNVVLNFDRWRFASPAWTGGGGNLDDYRTMVINHETGHWFGFGHRFCSGAGQLAPVMQQQSISLQGCAANPWPLPYEKAAL